MPQGSVTGRRPPGAGAAGPPAPTIDVARLRVAIARLSRWLRRHELAGLTPTQLSALSTVDRMGPLRLVDLAAAEGQGAKGGFRGSPPGAAPALEVLTQCVSLEASPADDGASDGHEGFVDVVADLPA